MQNSLWKLLTAVGIIGIGTLVVLEVQNRLPSSGISAGSSAAVVQSGPTETSVVPNDTTELDSLLESAGNIAGFQSPETLDAGRAGTSAPPADDSRSHKVTAVSQTVHKDNRTDAENLFAMDEPSEEPTAASKNHAGADPGFSGQATVQPVAAASGSFSSAANDGTELRPALPLPDANDVSDSPFPAEFSAATDSTPAGQPEGPELRSSMVDSTANLPDASSTMFFKAGDQPADNAGEPDTAEAFANAVPAAESSGTTPTSRVERTAMAQESENGRPEMFVPEPVPDVTRPAGRTAQEKEIPGFSASEIIGGAALNSPASDRRSGGHPRTEPKDDETVPVFGIESPAAFSPGRPDGISASDTESEPFTEDSPSADPQTPRPTPAGDFPVPTYPGDPANGFSERSGTGDGEPFGGPGDGSPDSAEPLPTADDRPSRNDGTGSGIQTDVIASARTVSEVIRPQLTIQKQAPETATVGVSHDYTIVVTNEGDSPAYDVIVEDELGTAADIVDSQPVAEFKRSTGQLSWILPELKPHERKEITVRITPTGEGTLDGVATVRFKAQVKSATVITAPKLDITVNAPDEVKVGDEVQLQFVVSNNGSGDAATVILRSVLPPGLKHPEGGDLEYEIELLRAGDRETVELAVIAAEPGEQIRISAEVTASGVSADQTYADIAIVGAQLSVERLGPERRFVGRTASYQNIITNETNFEATDAVVVEQIPEGMRFISANQDGEYNPQKRQVRWAIPRLTPGKQAVLEIELEAESAGQMESMVEVTESAGFRTRADENTVVTVEDVHNMTADISRLDEPVVIGERFGFTITIDNRGTAVARNVQMSVQVPPEIKVLAAGNRDVAGKLMTGNLVKYDTVLMIQPDQKMTFQLTLQGQEAVRNAVVQAYLTYEEMQEPMKVSESVTVLDDQP